MSTANVNRRDFLRMVPAAAAAAAMPRAALVGQTPPAKARRPNVILFMTDDQGYGDLGCHGNEKIRTPNIDRLYAQSVRMTQFHVCPVCAPTRACLMTGRYNFRTGAVDTYLGRAMMHTEEVTLAEMLRAAGYRTGIFGKWHLGDNYPLRPGDQGFDESLVHNGGGIGQPSDPPGNRYFDPVLQRNGKPVKSKGYCTDIFTDAAIAFIASCQAARPARPFFAYIPTNAPHGPLEVADKYVKPYKAMGLDDRTARVYAMCENIDENVGKLMRRLTELKIDRETIFIFLTDNGPAGRRYNAGMRAAKGSVYQGGIRVPFFLRWPARLKGGVDVDRIGAHIDVAPTLLSACGAATPKGVKFDGLDLMPLLTGGKVDWPDRTLFFQWHRGDVPQLYRACAARDQRYKIVQPGSGPKFQLYDLRNDPGEKTDLADKHPDIVARLKKQYEDWFRDVSGTRGYAPPRIHLGTPHENPVILTRQDWRGPRAGWGPKSLGHWETLVAKRGTFDVRLRFSAAHRAEGAVFRMGEVTRKQALQKGASACVFKSVDLPAGPGRLEAWITAAQSKIGVLYVDVKRLD